jgi:hypothetical protein
MSSTFLYKKIETLPEHLKLEVNDFIDFLVSKENKKAKPALKDDNSIMKFAGIITDEEADELKKIIEDGCGKVNLDDWK